MQVCGVLAWGCFQPPGSVGMVFNQQKAGPGNQWLRSTARVSLLDVEQCQFTRQILVAGEQEGLVGSASMTL